MPTRRALIRALGAPAAAGLAGCGTGAPMPYTWAGVSLRAPFDTEPPVTVPLDVEVVVQNVDSRAVALEGVDLVVCDAAREPLAQRTLGRFSWRGAETERRRTERHDDLLSSATVYRARWTLEREVRVDRVPEFLALRVDAVRFGDGAAGLAMVGGGRRASTPPPAFEASVETYDGARPAPERVGPEQYSVALLRRGRGSLDDEVLLPPPDATPTGAGGGSPDPGGNRTATGTPNGTTRTDRTETSGG